MTSEARPPRRGTPQTSPGPRRAHASHGHVDHWPDHVEDGFNSIDGLDYDAAIQFIRDTPEKVDAVWQENQMVQLNAGHGGVPLMVFQGEPFFGQDRFDLFYWRLRQSGLTERWQPRAPFTTKPLRWPDNL